ncbi:hypothetical protein CANARDRAFT_199592 [[Candida] arabinofermentans NRRL YB-2248]|uniref:NADH:ubiquinone oxidoreductase intermediate-associated protein 30 domain-containing protein n=1 Tax=[Candida] arabinofermentans NRRL YB-2248 TaxID=983967 RepID=A0A1E4SZM9_9ASCO|nr:hypothetical protein CANARDRAFT_199592 [[Candida] arabinofermentans NRRL YB-2248]
MFKNFAKKFLLPPSKPTQQTLLDFSNLATFQRIETGSDASLGGFSTVNFEPYRLSSNAGGRLVAHFHGNLNQALPPTNPKVKKSGWSMMKTKNRQKSQQAQFKPFYWSERFANFWWDFSPYHVLYLRVKNNFESRRFMVNIQTDTMSRTDLYQHRLFIFTPTLGSDNSTGWRDVFIQLDDFVLTNRGAVQVQYQGEFEKDRIKSIGISISDGKPGEFSLLIDKIEVLSGVDYLERLGEARNRTTVDDDVFLKGDERRLPGEKDTYFEKLEAAKKNKKQVVLGNGESV